MKIALVCTEKLPVPPVAGGAIQLYIEGIIPYLAKHHKITVFSIEYQGLSAEEKKEKTRYVRVPGNNVIEYVNNLKTRISDKYDLVHVFNRPSWILPLSGNLPDAKFSLSLHNEMFNTDKISADEAKKCINRVKFINTVSRFVAEGVQKLYPEAKDRLNVVYSGADIDKYRSNWSREGILNKSMLKEKFKIQDYKVVLFVGRLSVKKGIHILLRAMEKVMTSHPGTALVVIGSKWYGKNEEDDYVKSIHILSKNLKGPVVFTGFLPPSQIPSCYNMGDIFVCPSQWDEPLARVHYEAMAAGLPIITTNRGGNAEVVSGYGNGIVIDDYGNPEAFAGHISYLLDNPDEALKMGKTGRKLARERFNWKIVAENILKAFARVERKLAPAKLHNTKPGRK